METPVLTDLPARTVLAVDGRGAPEDPPFAAALRALYAVRAALGAPADVPAEGTYTQGGDPARFDLDAPDGWHWTLAVPAPPDRTAEAVATAAELLHRGPYADEGPSLDALHAFVAARGLRPAGPHTEVYLTDPAVTAPADNRTLLRIPVWTG